MFRSKQKLKVEKPCKVQDILPASVQTSPSDGDEECSGQRNRIVLPGVRAKMEGSPPQNMFVSGGIHLFLYTFCEPAPIFKGLEALNLPPPP